MYQELGNNSKFRSNTGGDGVWFYNQDLAGSSLAVGPTTGEHFVVTGGPSGGNVGIGTTSPLAKLDVYGNMIISGAVTDTRYLNFGPVSADSGFGFRSNAGAIEYKSSGDANWSKIGKTSIRITQAGHGLSVKNAVKISTSTGAYEKAQADSVENAEVVGVVIEVDGNDFVLSTNGLADGLSGLSEGQTYYLSTSTPGALVDYAPTGLGEVSKPIMVAKSSTEAYVINYRGVQLDNFSVNTGSTGEMAYYTSSDIVGSTDNLMIDGSNVGIGTSTAVSKLTIDNGDVYITDSSSGIIMKDTATGDCHRVRITNGVLDTGGSFVCGSQ